MRKLVVMAVLVVSALALAAVNLDVFGNYHFTLSASPTAAASISYLSFGLQVGYEVTEGVQIGGGVGLAYFLPDATAATDFLGAASSTQWTLDFTVGAKYSIPVNDFSAVVVKGYGGLSVPGFTGFDKLGYIVGAKVLYVFDMVDFNVGLGAGIEMRSYGSSSITTIPVGVTANIRF
ncbi:MAG: outer membrane beta-barrel protein [Pseudothermotoga sp.]|uniref:hypothetical protein n=1 Tax=Pseudothermotoga sp. TaxID=2033661 RepID=UPI0019BE4A94|nr:outer membrane beta-barrel protein [Pseudothermotoga sp.]MDK2922830.1 hypothetical protein [Pseudothermotoga sp.]